MENASAEKVAPPESIFRQTQIPNQRTFSGVPLPMVLSPPAAGIGLAEAICAYKPWLEAQLKECGALLFRGFPVPTAYDFNQVLEAFGYEDAPFVASGAPRAHVVGRILTSNDGPSHMKLYSHNEMAYIKDHPSKVFFYCEVEPETEGQTPIVLGHVLYERMKEKHPEFVEHLEKHGLRYTRVIADGHDPNSMIGRSWQSTFDTNDKVVAEYKAAQLGWELEWVDNGAVRANMAIVPGVKTVDYGPKGERKVWFNNLAAAYLTWSDSRNEQGKGVMFADGTPLPKDVMEDYLKILEEESVAFAWQNGDILMLDNYTVQHARNPFTGRRRVLAAFTK